MHLRRSGCGQWESMLSGRLSRQGEADGGAVTGQGLGAQAACSERCARLARSQKPTVLGQCIFIGPQEVLHRGLCRDLQTCSNFQAQ